MENVKHKIISFWLTHVFLRRIGKRYPDFFKQWVYETTDNRIERKIMLLQYTGDNQMKFFAIALELNTDERNVFAYHKKFIDRLITGI
jgi:hypothetical protein